MKLYNRLTSNKSFYNLNLGPEETDESAERSKSSDKLEKGDSLSNGDTGDKAEQLPDSGLEVKDDSNNKTSIEGTDNEVRVDQVSVDEPVGQGDGDVKQVLVNENEAPEINHVDLGDKKIEEKPNRDNERQDSAGMLSNVFVMKCFNSTEW